ncbi:response regulator transcription factor [Variovorax gossypii]|uniref:Response regulator transcription factor n=1 Tax=Variovorax gossypii TaxID=1679495 RepID=A0A431TIS7_9BURK|nr:winged helix-turn-helix domain-containing protein [Variovorax gossypii]RTQ32952.1 response regulator transcription factor [Variovorax gossypii]
MSFDTVGALPLALLCAKESQGPSLHDRLQQMGHECLAFAEADEVLVALGGGRRFALLLVSQHDEALHSGLIAVSKVLGMPVLLTVADGHWELLSPKGNDTAPAGMLAADVSRMSNDELDWLACALARPRRDGTPMALGHAHGATAWGDYRFHEDRHVVQFRNDEIQLQPRQFAFALQAFRNLGRVLAREWLWNALWGAATRRDGNRALDACASSVRRKLGLHGEHGFLLRSVYGQGYQLVAMQRHGSCVTTVTAAAARSEAAAAA